MLELLDVYKNDSCTFQGASFPASPDNLITQWIKGAPTDEGFLSGLHVLLCLMNEPATERPGDWEHGERCSPPQNVAPCPSPSSFSMAVTAAVVGKVFDSQANNFPLCTSLCRFFLLSLCLRWEEIAETKDLWRTCFSSSIHPPSTPLLCSFIYLESIEQNKSRCLVTALVSVGVPPEGKPVSMTREPPEEYSQQQHQWWAGLLARRWAELWFFSGSWTSGL